MGKSWLIKQPVKSAPLCRSPSKRRGRLCPFLLTLSLPHFHIVGIGASAGGLEAFEQLFRACPSDTGMAFLLVPHLDPGHLFSLPLPINELELFLQRSEEASP
jgi:chemotaxis response regulator CheB